MAKAIVGGNWGDEGKGKLTDLLAESADIVVRFQGGANAGHTIINEYGRFALHLLPSGVFRAGVVNVLAQGVALDLEKLFAELDALVAQGVPMPQLKIADRAQLLLPYHVLFDRLEEARLGAQSFGSTKSGIAPFYADKYLKTGVQVCDLFEDEYLRRKLERACSVKNAQIDAIYGPSLAALGEAKPDPEKIYQALVAYRERVRPLVCDVAVYMHDAVQAGKRILLEGQLGALKDPDNGIYPFVTSSSPLAGFGYSTGLAPYEIREVVTVVKAYSSAVGAGAFVSELAGDEAEELRRRGGDRGEYGATTGRPRRVGWFDAVASRYGCRLQGATEVALTLLDVLGYLPKIPVCVGYEIDGEVVRDFPATPRLDRAKPVLAYLDGWMEDIRDVRSYDALPENAKRYVEFVERELGVPVKMVSNGPTREQILYR